MAKENLVYSRAKSKPSIFARLVTISGLTVPFEYFMWVILESFRPFVDAMENRYLDPPEKQREYAAKVRRVSAALNLNVQPIILNQREPCTSCGHYRLTLVQPSGRCWECWYTKPASSSTN
jgi:hypothetical protein